MAELKARLKAGAAPDYITLGGSGEPCLHSEIGQIILEIKKISSFPVAVLTNGSLLWDPDVQKDLGQADVVLPSLDCHNPETFAQINRPYAGISFEKMVSGLEEFRKKYTGKLWLEIFIVSGINDTLDAMEAFKTHLKRISPDRIHLNTAVRPTAEKSAVMVPADKLQILANAIDPKAEVVAEFVQSNRPQIRKDMEAEILDMLMRRPCTASDIAAGLGLREDAVMHKMAQLTNAGQVETKQSNGRIYYFRASAS